MYKKLSYAALAGIALAFAILAVVCVIDAKTNPVIVDIGNEPGQSITAHYRALEYEVSEDCSVAVKHDGRYIETSYEYIYQLPIDNPVYNPLTDAVHDGMPWCKL